MASTKAWDSCKRSLLLPPLPSPPPKPQNPSYLSLFFQVCCTRGGKDRIYHLSAFGSPELRDAGQHKIIIHRHEITKPPGDPTTKLLHFFPLPKTQRSMFAWAFFWQTEMLDLIWWRKMTAKGRFGDTVLHTCGVRKKVLKQLWPLFRVNFCEGTGSTLHSRFTTYSHYWLSFFIGHFSDTFIKVGSKNTWAQRDLQQNWGNNSVYFYLSENSFVIFTCTVKNK